MNYYIRSKSWPHISIFLSQSLYEKLSRDTKQRLTASAIWNDTRHCWEGMKGEKDMLALCRELCLEDRTVVELLQALERREPWG
jgi:hypothetical protein